MKKIRDILTKDVAERIKEIRDKLELSQEQLAEKLGCSRSNISQIEKGLFLPGANLMQGMKSIFNIRLDWLFSGQGAMLSTEMDKDLDLLDFDKDSDEIKLMLTEMKNSPALKYRVLSDFYTSLGEMRLKNKEDEGNGDNGKNGGDGVKNGA